MLFMKNLENKYFKKYEKNKSFLLVSFDMYLDILADLYTKTKDYFKLDEVLTLIKFYKDEEI